MRISWIAHLSLLALASAVPRPAAVPATTTVNAAKRTLQPPFPVDVDKRGSNSSAVFPTTGSGLGTGTASGPRTTPILSTYTDHANGVVYRCTGLEKVSSEIIGAPGQTYTSGEMVCNGGPTLTTNTALINTSISGWTNPLNKTSFSNQTLTGFPSTGCKITTTSVASPSPTVETLCRCAGDVIAGTQVFISRTQATTLCAVGTEPTPTGWTQVPNGDGAPSYFANVTGDCGTGSLTTNAKCWNDLDLSDYVTWWWQTFNETCQHQNLGFGDCFYSLQAGLGPSNCSQATQNPECQQPLFEHFQDNWNGPRNFYVAYNIWNMATFFSRYWGAVSEGQQDASAALGVINDKINPPQSTNVGINEIMVALTVGLAAVAAPEGAPIWFGPMLAAVQNIPGVARYLLPSVDGNEQSTIALNNIQNSLGQLAQQWEDSISTGLPLLLNSATNFIAAGKDGAYSNSQPDLSEIVKGILPGLYTYSAAQMWAANNVVMVRTPNTDVSALQHNGTSLRWDTGCDNGYDATTGMCGEFWYSKTNHTTYALLDTRNALTTYFNDPLQTLFSQYTSGENFFLGGDNCARMSSSNTKPNQPSFGNLALGAVGAVCMSNLPVCTWATLPDPNGNTISTNCDANVLSESTYKPSTLGGGNPDEWIVQKQYLGYGIINAGYSFTCPSC